MKNYNLNNENGRSMIEMLGVLAIIGVLSVGGIAGYSKAMHKYRINKTIEQITLIAGNIRTFFGPRGNYEEVSCNGNSCNNEGCASVSGCTIVKKAKIIPEDMLDYITSTSFKGNIKSITNPFGGTLGISSTPKSMEGDKKAFSIFYTLEDNQEACIELLSQDWSNVSSNVIFYITPSNYANLYYAVAPLSLDDAVKACTKPKVTKITIHMFIDVDPSGEYWQNKLSTYPI